MNPESRSMSAFSEMDYEPSLTTDSVKAARLDQYLDEAMQTEEKKIMKPPDINPLYPPGKLSIRKKSACEDDFEIKEWGLFQMKLKNEFNMINVGESVKQNSQFKLIDYGRELKSKIILLKL